MIYPCLNQCKISQAPAQEICQEDGDKFYPWAVMLKKTSYSQKHTLIYFLKQTYAMQVKFCINIRE
jgi:hypothetical protein